jgi:hypothetical protein
LNGIKKCSEQPERNTTIVVNFLQKKEKDPSENELQQGTPKVLEEPTEELL